MKGDGVRGRRLRTGNYKKKSMPQERRSKSHFLGAGDSARSAVVQKQNSVTKGHPPVVTLEASLLYNDDESLKPLSRSSTLGIL